MSEVERLIEATLAATTAGTGLTGRIVAENLAIAGYTIVRSEPTEPMLDAGLESLGESTGMPTAFIVRDVLFAYRAMVEASVQGYGRRYL